MTLINAKRLRDLKACSDQLAKFIKIFGEGDAPLSVETAVKHASEFDWTWASSHLLSPEAYAEYQRAMAPAYAEYQRVMAETFARLYIGEDG